MVFRLLYLALVRVFGWLALLTRRRRALGPNASASRRQLAERDACPWVHAPGQVFADLAVVVADGADAVSGIDVLGDREALFGAVASMPTA